MSLSGALPPPGPFEVEPLSQPPGRRPGRLRAPAQQAARSEPRDSSATQSKAPLTSPKGRLKAPVGCAPWLSPGRSHREASCKHTTTRPQGGLTIQLGLRNALGRWEMPALRGHGKRRDGHLGMKGPLGLRGPTDTARATAAGDAEEAPQSWRPGFPMCRAACAPRRNTKV